MTHLPEIISDLALILISAGIVTIIFKRLGQPLVLGYIVAGFLAGPHMPYTPTIIDSTSINTWADIGVIFLMFTLGLEFSFKKILTMGAKPIVAACIVMFCMMSVGSVVGHAFGWSSMDSLFLGGMLAMSSTTIIYKAFDDLGLRRQKFAGEVLSVLVLEDILGILLMVVLSAMAVSRDFEGTELIGSLLKLAFFLILWFIVGIYIVPTFLRKSGKWMNNETLLVVAIGLCFMLVAIAAKVGYSSAFGAFMMGSILAETIEAEKIEHVVGPVKDLFGAIFFVSVGMLVDPSVLAHYWLPIVVITLAVIVGQMIFGTTSFLISGQSLRVAMQCGFSLAQIGEFAFIIASLGITLGVTSDFLYPVVVAVSIVTTFLTPYMIKAATPLYSVLQKYIPSGIQQRLSDKTQEHVATHTPWKSLLKALISQFSIYTTLSIAVILLTFGILLPFTRTALGLWVGNGVCGLLTILVVAPFLRAIVMKKNHSEEWKALYKKGSLHRLLLWMTVGVRFLMASALVLYILNSVSPLLSPWRYPVHIAGSMLIVALMVASRRIKLISIRLERTFLKNLRSRDVIAQQKGSNTPAYAGRLLSHNMHLAMLQVPSNSRWGGDTLTDLNLGKETGVIITAIVRDAFRINIPDGRTQLFPGDCLEVLGNDDNLEIVAHRLQTEVVTLPINTPANALLLRRVVITEYSSLCNKALRDSGLKEHFRCMAVGFETDDGTIDLATPVRTICRGDILWVVGEKDALAMLEKEQTRSPQ